MHQRLEVADRELSAARKLFAETDDDRARRNTPFIDLELLRIRDLRGDHAGALSAFDAVARDVPTHDKQTLTATDIDQVKYEGTRLHYRLAAAIKVAELDAADSSGLLIEEIFRTVKQVNQLPAQRPIADRLCCLMVLAGQYFLQLALEWRCAKERARGTSDGQSGSDESVPSLADKDRDWIVAKLGEIKENLSVAWKIQRSFELNNVRPPRSGIEYGGLSVLDVSGLLQKTLLFLGEARSDPELVWEALVRADEIKGRFFQRDLAFSAAQPPDRVPVVVARALTDLRSSLLSGIGDHRVVMAEFDRAIHFDMAKQDARQYIEETSFEGALTRDEIRTLLKAEGVRSGFVSFYATPRETLVYLVTSADESPRVTRFQIDASAVELASAHLKGDLRGYSTVDDDRVDPLLNGLRRLFEAMLPQLLHLSRIVISPHGPWHGIPLHVVLLPLLWHEGKEVGTVYVPSLKAWHLLHKRRHAMAAYGGQPIALTTAPAREDIEEMFAEEYRGIRAVLERTGRTVSAAFGQEATLQRGLEDLRNCGVHHFLAHGVDAGSDNAMSSGLLLASESGGLPSRSYTASGNPAMSSAPVLASDRGSRSSSDDAAPMRARMLTAALMMANGTTASHVTLQACSVGRPSAAFRDELWGVTRALLAGGTSTVLAPLWDLDLRSSSQLLRRFYEQWLLHGQPAWLALASAQREMATGRTEEFRHFSHWGALQLAGC